MMRNSYTIALILQTFAKGKSIHTSNVKSMIQLLCEVLGISVLKPGISTWCFQENYNRIKLKMSLLLICFPVIFFLIWDTYHTSRDNSKVISVTYTKEIQIWSHLLQRKKKTTTLTHLEYKNTNVKVFLKLL